MNLYLCNESKVEKFFRKESNSYECIRNPEFREWLDVYQYAKLNETSLISEGEPEHSFRLGTGLQNVFHVREMPLESMKEMYGQGGADGIKDTILKWQFLAITSMSDNAFDDGAARADLIRFCSNLCRLYEAWKMIIFRSGYMIEEGRPLYIHIPETKLLTASERSRPLTVLNEFVKQYAWQKCWSALWDLLDAVISYEGDEDAQKFGVLLDFEFLFCLMEASIHYKPSEADQTVTKAPDGSC